jgi:hypothetical protein
MRNASRPQGRQDRRRLALRAHARRLLEDLEGGAAVSLIFSCPDCQSDLQDNYWDFWCGTCERSISWLEFAEFDTDDERNDFLTEVAWDGK